MSVFLRFKNCGSLTYLLFYVITMEMYLYIMFLTNLMSYSHSEKILCIFPIPSASHLSIYQTVSTQLSLRGHQVTVITPCPLKDENLINLTEIEVSTLRDIPKRHPDRMRKLSREDYFFRGLLYAEQYYISFVEEVLIHVDSIFPDPTTEFDLIILENVHHLVYSVGCRFRAPIIGIMSNMVYFFDHNYFGNPTNPALYFELGLNKMEDTNSFYEKVKQVVVGTTFQMTYDLYYLVHTDRKSKQYFGAHCPHIKDIRKNVSLFLVNTNPFLHLVRPNVPALIELGGLMHIRPKQPLPHDLQIFLDQSTQGVIYFSLGSDIKSSFFSETTRNIIIQAFSELPFNVLWLWDLDELPNKPKNVMIKKWLPQQDILGHHNVKAFVSPGGLQSVEEAIISGVPLIGMPCVLEQYSIVRRLVKLGIAQSIDHTIMTKDQLKNIINEVAENKKYKEAIKQVRDLYEDQPLQSLEKAVWGIEYVIRHKGAKHLQSPAVNSSWYENFLVDVIAVVLFILSGSLCVAFLIVKMIRGLFRRFK